MLRNVVAIASIIQLLATSAVEIPHVTPNQLASWPDDAYEYYFAISSSAQDREHTTYQIFAVSLSSVQ